MAAAVAGAAVATMVATTTIIVMQAKQHKTTFLLFLFVRTCAAGQGRVLLVFYVFKAEPLDKAEEYI